MPASYDSGVSEQFANRSSAGYASSSTAIYRSPRVRAAEAVINTPLGDELFLVDHKDQSIGVDS
jgi:hypothetical protein